MKSVVEVHSARHTSPSILNFSCNPLGLPGPHTKHLLAEVSSSIPGRSLKAEEIAGGIVLVSIASNCEVKNGLQTLVYHRAVITLDQIRDRVAKYCPQHFDIQREPRQAATALILQTGSKGVEMLFIKRAEFEGDPWSGQMSFPGGHVDSTDIGLRAAAERETFEEIGLSLSMAQYCGSLSHQRTFGRGNRPGTLVAPFVYVNQRVFEPKLSSEVAAVVWGSVDDMRRGNLDAIEERLVGNQPTRFNGYLLGQNRFVWGLTYRTLQEFFKVLDPQYVEPMSA